MPVLFLDSSALVKRYVGEKGSLWVQRQTDATAQNFLYVVRLTGVEVVSAIARKARAGGMSAADALSATADFQADFPAAYNLVEYPIADSRGHALGRETCAARLRCPAIGRRPARQRRAVRISSSWSHTAFC